MAEPVVSFVVERLGDLLLKEASFLHGVSDQVRQLQRELRLMKGFLEEADRRQEEDKSVQAWVSEIREAAYAAEDAVETFVLTIASRRRGGVRNTLKRYACIIDEAAELHKVGTEIDAIKASISILTTRLETYGIKPKNGGEGSSSAQQMQRQWRQSYAHVEEYTVGLDEGVNILVTELLNEEKPGQVVSICGMGGLGKTTLAKKVFHHSATRSHFDGFAWAYISQQCQRRDVWEGVLFELISPSQSQRKEIKELRDEEVASKLFQAQMEKKCLVILDDFWRFDTWDSLSSAFPVGQAAFSDGRKAAGSKILLTTRIRDVAQHADPSCFLYEPHCLNEKEGWKLLQKKAFPRNHGPDFEINRDMENLGRKIVEKCAGLPLAIVVIGGLLATKRPTPNDWNMVYEDISLYLGRGKGHEQNQSEVSRVLALSYNELPYQLKPCFHHLSQFPEDFEIPTKKLIRMWVAEGIVSPLQEGEETLEDVADRYLGELLDRCMIQGVRGSTGRVKTCRLHDLMRDLCLLKADEENFVKIVHFKDQNKQVGSISSAYRVHRLAVYLGEKPLKSFLEQERTLYFRSLLFFSSDSKYGTITSGKMLSRLSDFKLLKILDMEQCWIRRPKKENWIPGKLDSAIGNLIYLRYLSLNCDDVTNLPSSIGNLRSLQTLILNKYADRLIIPNVMWKMEQLRHLYLPRNPQISKGKLRVGNLTEMQTLQGFHTNECDVNDLTKLPNLKKLGVRSESLKELVEVLRSSRVTFNSLCSLKCEFGYSSSAQETNLRMLLSGCPHLYKLYLNGGPIVKLPEYHYFPQNLIKLTLMSSFLVNDPMPTLGKLPYLSILRLQRYAFTRKKMVCSSKSFPQLKSLLLGNLDNLEEWCVGEEAMSSLCQLVIECCRKLKMVPDGLRFITTLRELQIERMPEEFVNRLRGGEDLYKVQHVPSIIFKSDYV